MKKVRVEIIDENTPGVDMQGYVHVDDDEDAYHWLISGVDEEEILNETLYGFGYRYYALSPDVYDVIDMDNESVGMVTFTHTGYNDEEFFKAIFEEIGYELEIV